MDMLIQLTYISDNIQTLFITKALLLNRLTIGTCHFTLALVDLSE